MSVTTRLRAVLKAAREHPPDAIHVLEIDGRPVISNIRRSFRTAVEQARMDPRR